MPGDRISELRLTAFKSFREVVVPLGLLAILIGRNSSGKSNALDGLEVLKRLASGEDVRDALDGSRRESAPIRGGSAGCAPFGLNHFELGVTIEDTESGRLSFDVRVQVEPHVQLVWEKLTVTRAGRTTTLYETDEFDPARSDVRASVHNGKRGRDPHYFFRSSALLVTQVPGRISGKTRAEALVVAGARAVVRTLSGIFHLDPVPHLMRQYVPAQDDVLRRNADNLSAAVARLQAEDPELFTELFDVVAGLPEHTITGIDIRTGGFGELMLGLQEQQGSDVVTVPARQMSDGILRLMAIVTALLTGGAGLAVDSRDASGEASLILVIEELENGLHPAQASRLLSLLRQAVHRRGFQVVATTHSPALLDGLTGDEHAGVLVVDRIGSARSSRIRSLIDIPGYAATMARGSLGESVTSNRLTSAAAAMPIAEDDLDRLLGIS